MGSVGDAQEARAKDFVRRLGYAEVVAGESNIKSFLKIKVVQGEDSNCADIVGFKPNFKNAASAIVCESKGTEVDHALVQLGNVAAALLEQFAAVRKLTEVVLLVYRSRLRKLDIGDSPGPLYIVGERNLAGMRPLVHAGTDDRKAAPASACVDMKRLDVRLTRWGEQVAKLPVYVYVEQ
jgi:hypothetical protein